MVKRKFFNKYVFIFIFVLFFIVGFFLLLMQINKIVGRAIHKNKEVIAKSVIGMTLDEARQLLSKDGLLISKSEDFFDSKIKHGHIISQFPKEGSVVRIGRVINVVISKGVGGLKIPNVVGIEQRQAESILKNAGFIIGQEELLYSMSIPKGEVIEQDPSSVMSLSSGGVVNLKISNGIPPENIKLMPNLIGQSKDSAIVLLNIIGVSCKIEFVETNKLNEKGLVLFQYPDEDKEILEGEVVIIKIGN